MVIKLLEINPAATSITASVEVDTGNTVVQAVAWNKDTYKVDSEGINITHLLAGVSELEDFSISAAELGVEKITGFYAIEFSSSASAGYKVPETAEEFPETGVVVNLLPYYECVTDKALSVTVKNCEIVKSTCDEIDTYLFSSTLLDAIHNTLIFALYKESIEILKTLDCMCEVCTACPSYGEGLTQAGYSYKTVNNILILA